MQEYIKVYRKALSPKVCGTIIGKFDQAELEVHHTDGYKFDQINLSTSSAFEEEVHQSIIPVVKHFVELYNKELKIKYFPEKYGYEQLRLKKYPKDGYFKEHVDVMDYASARRFLSIFMYLNECGGTKFGDKLIKPEIGTLVIFPPLWMFPHTGLVSKGEKYFLSTYLHYI